VTLAAGQLALVQPSIRYPGVYPDGFLLGTTAAGYCLSIWYHWCRVRELNSRPTVYKTAALPLS
jgi:hypothetical protein